VDDGKTYSLEVYYTFEHEIRPEDESRGRWTFFDSTHRLFVDGERMAADEQKRVLGDWERKLIREAIAANIPDIRELE
jgi:hypothetical protein